MRKAKEHRLQRRPPVGAGVQPPDNVGGIGFDVCHKTFPTPQSGMAANFGPIPQVPADADFEKWVDYFVRLIGSKVQLANAVQFRLDEGQARVLELARVVGELADALHVGTADAVPGNIGKLIWPLSGPHFFMIPQPPRPIEFNHLTVQVLFYTEWDYMMVVDCDIRVTADLAGGIAPVSSSSSFLATSSSSG